MTILRTLPLVLSALVPLHHAYAACQAETTDGLPYYIVLVQGFNPPPFSPGAIPVGGVIYEAEAERLWFSNAKNGWGPVSRCDPPVRTYKTGVGTLGADNIYATSVPNVGLRIGDWRQPYPTLSPGLDWWTMEWNIIYAPKIQLIKTGNVTAPGVLSGAYARYTANSAAGETLVEYRFASPVAVTPKVPTCKVDTPTIPVPMGQVIAATTFTGVGSTAPLSAPFMIRLSCSGGDLETSTRAYVTLTDATNPQNTTKTLSLSPSSTAKGVGIQVLKDEVVLGFGPDSSAAGAVNQWSAGTVQQGQAGLTIKLQARYVQTASRITSGSANANATFTMSYQ